MRLSRDQSDLYEKTLLSLPVWDHYVQNTTSMAPFHPHDWTELLTTGHGHRHGYTVWQAFFAKKCHHRLKSLLQASSSFAQTFKDCAQQSPITVLSEIIFQNGSTQWVDQIYPQGIWHQLSKTDIQQSIDRMMTYKRWKMLDQLMQQTHVPGQPHPYQAFFWHSWISHRLAGSSSLDLFKKSDYWESLQHPDWTKMIPELYYHNKKISMGDVLFKFIFNQSYWGPGPAPNTVKKMKDRVYQLWSLGYPFEHFFEQFQNNNERSLLTNHPLTPALFETLLDVFDTHQYPLSPKALQVFFSIPKASFLMGNPMIQFHLSNWSSLDQPTQKTIATYLGWHYRNALEQIHPLTRKAELQKLSPWVQPLLQKPVASLPAATAFFNELFCNGVIRNNAVDFESLFKAWAQDRRFPALYQSLTSPKDTYGIRVDFATWGKEYYLEQTLTQASNAPSTPKKRL